MPSPRDLEHQVVHQLVESGSISSRWQEAAVEFLDSPALYVHGVDQRIRVITA
jgi:hypothetical protein